jgi:hypothetical protein
LIDWKRKKQRRFCGGEGNGETESEERRRTGGANKVGGYKDQVWFERQLLVRLSEIHNGVVVLVVVVQVNALPPPARNNELSFGAREGTFRGVA